MKRFTDEEIRTLVYANTMQETSDNVEWFIKGMMYMRDITFDAPVITSDKDIYERDGDKIYARKFGSNPQTRVLING